MSRTHATEMALAHCTYQCVKLRGSQRYYIERTSNHVTLASTVIGDYRGGGTAGEGATESCQVCVLSGTMTR